MTKMICGGIDKNTIKSLVCYNGSSGSFIWLKRLGSGHGIKIFNGQFSGKSIGGFVGKDGYFYIDILIDGKRHRNAAHRLAWLYVYGQFPPNEVDHINRVKTDNRIVNLRLATTAQNGCNKPLMVTNTSGYPGVSWHKVKKKWRAMIKVNGKAINLGCFSNIEDANAAYVTASIAYAKDFSIYARRAA